MDTNEVDLVAMREDAERYLAYGGDVPGGNVARFVLALTDQTRLTVGDCWADGWDAATSLDGAVVVKLGVDEHNPFRVSVRTRGDLARLRLALRSGGPQ